MGLDKEEFDSIEKNLEEKIKKYYKDYIGSGGRASNKQPIDKEKIERKPTICEAYKQGIDDTLELIRRYLWSINLKYEQIFINKNLLFLRGEKDEKRNNFANFDCFI